MEDSRAGENRDLTRHNGKKPVNGSFHEWQRSCLDIFSYSISLIVFEISNTVCVCGLIIS